MPWCRECEPGEAYPVEERDAVEEVRVHKGQGAGSLAEPGSLHLQKPRGEQRRCLAWHDTAGSAEVSTEQSFAGDCESLCMDCPFVLPRLTVNAVFVHWWCQSCDHPRLNTAEPPLVEP